MNKQMNEWKDGWMHACMHACIHRGKDGWMSEWLQTSGIWGMHEQRMIEICVQRSDDIMRVQTVSKIWTDVLMRPSRYGG